MVWLRQTVSPTRVGSPIQLRLSISTPSWGARISRAPSPSRERRMSSAALAACTSMSRILLRPTCRSTDSLFRACSSLAVCRVSSISPSTI
jgi:hypothetical protein